MSLLHRFYPYFHKGRFANHVGEKHRTVFWHSMIMCVQTILQKKQGHERLAEWLMAPHLRQPLNSQANPVVTWIGHSTFLISINGVNILTDPIFGSPSIFFPRLSPAGISFSELPPIDLVLISHNHPDHMDASTLYSLEQHHTVTFMVPQGDKAWFERRGFKRVREFMWWDQHTFTPTRAGTGNATITFLPALHWSQRGIFDRNRSLWGSWMIEGVHAPPVTRLLSTSEHSFAAADMSTLQETATPMVTAPIETNGSISRIPQQYRIYFAGDTAYGKHFSAIAHEFPTIDVALMPVGPCEPNAWMRSSHVNAEEAGQGFLDLGARQFIPMHWGTYWFGLEYPLVPIDRLISWWQTHRPKLESHYLSLIKFGESLSITPPVLPSVKVPELEQSTL
jgi:L-ascorbate metabolism protein UlaG (beta-lactamase superfamily)